MLNYYSKGIASLGTTISLLFGINTGKGIVDILLNGNDALMNKLIPFLLLIIISTTVIIFVCKKYSHYLKQIFGGIVALKTIIFSSEKSEWTDNDSLDEIIKASGYSYDSKQDIYYSNMDAWQKEFGYCRLYDEAAAPLGMIIDCEPIYFEYEGKRWLIEFWKGQYDLTTGCEIGVYTTKGPDLDIPGVFNGTYYNSASKTDLLKIKYYLIKNNEELFKRIGNHWWLTGFRLGEFSKPSELTMYISITLKSKTMLNQFVKGLKNAGYLDNEFMQKDNTVKIKYSKPHVPQPFTRTKVTDWIIQWKNRKLCEKFQEITKGYKTTPEKIEAIRQQAPKMFGLIMNIGKTKKIFEKYKTIQNFSDEK